MAIEMTQEEKARQLRVALEMFAQQTVVDDKTALSMSSLYPDWIQEGASYAKDNIVNYSDKLWRCVSAHTSQASWSPDKASSLWTEIKLNPDGTEEWTQPTGAHNCYPKGAIVTHGGKTWVSDIDGNVWEPGVYGWTQTEDSGSTEVPEPVDPEEPEEPTETYGDWVQPQGSHDAYSTGDIVSHNGKLWISTADANVWEPGVYGWEEYVQS